MSVVDDRSSVSQRQAFDALPDPPLVDEREHPVRVSATDVTEFDRDARRALSVAARALSKEFAETIDAETIERLLVLRYAELSTHARITTFLPLLAERSVRDHLLRLAT